MTKLFISDLHLYHQRPQVTQAFQRFLRAEAADSEALYILGDLFEVWIGDDDPDPHNQAVIEDLSQFTATGTPCYFIRGNRDFLIGQQFADRTGITLLEDGTKININGDDVLLMHGDTLCTDDVEYQRYRRIIRNPVTQAVLLSLPLSMRHVLARRARYQSMTSSAQKPEAIMDVNQSAVEATMREHETLLLLHGHTHRPAIHRFKINETEAKRIVLGDWYTQASILHWDEQGPALTALDYER